MFVEIDTDFFYFAMIFIYMKYIFRESVASNLTKNMVVIYLQQRHEIGILGGISLGDKVTGGV